MLQAKIFPIVVLLAISSLECLSQQDNPIPSLTERTEYLLELKEEVDEIWEMVQQHSSSQDIRTAKLFYDPDPSPMLFSASPGEVGLVRVTYGGLKSVDRISSAWALMLSTIGYDTYDPSR